MRKYLLFTAVFLVLLVSFPPPVYAGGAAPGQTRNCSLDDLIQLCFQHNMDIKAAQEKTAAQLAKVHRAKAQKLPGMTFTGVYSHIGVVPKFEMPGFEDIKFVNPDMVNFTASVDYTLFDWGLTKDGAKIEELGLKSQRLSTILMKKGFILQISLLYYNIQQITENEKVIKKNILILKEMLSLLEEQFAAGLIPEHQLLQTEVALESLTGQQLELEKMRSELLVTLKNISGLPLEQQVELEKPPHRETFSPADMERLLGTAFREREDFRLLNLQLAILQKSRTIISKTKLPLFSAGFNAELRNGIMPDVERLRTNWNIGLTVIYNIFDRKNAKFEKEALGHELQALRFNIEKLQRDVKANLKKLLANLKMLEEKILLEQRRFKIAEKSLELAQQSFKESRATYLEILNARSNYNLAESGLISLKYRKYINLLQIDFELHAIEYFLTKEEK